MTSTDTAREAAEQAWHDLLDKDDRTSPAEYPDMALITFDEFSEALSAGRRTAAEEMRERCAAEAEDHFASGIATAVRAIQIETEEPK